MQIKKINKQKNKKNIIKIKQKNVRNFMKNI